MKTIAAGLCAAVVLGQWSAAHAGALQLNYLGQQIVPTGESFNGTVVGGLSAIDYDAANNRYFALSDDRSQFNPARYYTVGLDLSQFNRAVNPGGAGVQFNSVTTLLDTTGSAFGPLTVDPEGLRMRDGKLFWTSEGERNPGTGDVQNPFVREAELNGTYVRDLEVPGYYNPVDANSLNAGIRQNLAFESLTFSNDGNTLYTATENSLGQDSLLPTTISGGSPSRILSMDVASGAAGAEYVYVTDAVIAPPNPITGFATNGLVELLNVPGMDGKLLAIERSFSVGVGNAIRLYLADLNGATDISGLSDLDAAGGPVTPVAKELLLDLSTLTNDDGTALVLDNIEGITWGASFDGNPTLVLVSDNNFSTGQFTQFLAFGVSQRVSEPASLAMLLPLSLALLGMRRHRRRPAVRCHAADRE